MPKVLEEAGFRVVIWPNDHEPAHVHMFKGLAHYAVVNVGHGQVSVRESTLNRSETTKAVALATKHRKFLLAEWRRIHEHDD